MKKFDGIQVNDRLHLVWLDKNIEDLDKKVTTMVTLIGDTFEYKRMVAQSEDLFEADRKAAT